MSSRIQQGSLNIDSTLYQLINEQVIPGTGINAEDFWQSFADILKDLAPKNRELLIKRDDLQHQIDVWHQERAGQALDRLSTNNSYNRLVTLYQKAMISKSPQQA